MRKLVRIIVAGTLCSQGLSPIAAQQAEPSPIHDPSPAPPPFAFERDLSLDPDQTGTGNVFAPILSAANEEGGSAWIPVAKSWEPGSELRVCFYSNDDSLNAFVASHAVSWNAVGANIKLDFGSMSAPRRCAPSVGAAIRVSFNNQNANFSRYGVDSMVSPPFWNTPSLHLDLTTVRGPRARGIILHEFGHALGLFHEHQKPVSDGCEKEFDWPRVYQDSLKYQGWDGAMVNSQFRPILNFYGYAMNEGIDLSSVMLYAMTPSNFLKGADSHCYLAQQNDEISEADAGVLRAAYTSGFWKSHGLDLGRAIASARDSGQSAVARALALYSLPKKKLDNISKVYATEQQLGFVPGPGKNARTQLQDTLDAAVNVAKQ